MTPFEALPPEDTSTTSTTSSTGAVKRTMHLRPIVVGRVVCLRCKKNVGDLDGANAHTDETGGKHRRFKGSTGRKAGKRA